jgi:ubiquinol-cytochrome c reductase subunit 7
LRYEDLLNSEWPTFKEAMELADKDVMTGRLRRLKRASDITLKGKVYTDYLPPLTMTEIYQEELGPDILKIEEREEEFAIMNLHKS